MQPDAPKNTYANETINSLVEGAALMSAMVRQSVFGEMAMPPQEIFTWYAVNAAYVFVTAEYRAIYEGGSVEEAKDAEDELKGVLAICEKTKQLVLIERIQTILRTRELHMPATAG